VATATGAEGRSMIAIWAVIALFFWFVWSCFLSPKNAIWK
jgi:hypothetical protein